MTPAISPTEEAPTSAPRTPQASPTPDPIRELPKLRDWTEVHTVRYGDTLNGIAYQYGVAVSQIVEANGILNPNILGIGWVLTIPPPIPESPGPELKIIPDSELIFGPSSIDPGLMNKGISLQGSLAQYEEIIEDRLVSGPEIVMRVAENHSINPRLIVAILEYQSKWASEKVEFTAGRVVPPGAGVNAGTVAVQFLFSQLYDLDSWRNVVSNNGFPRTLFDLFGDPFDYAVEPLVPLDLTQPELNLPFERGSAWSYTGGPHSAFGNTTAWAALDFAPSGNVLGCVTSNEWVVAATDGMVVRSGRGQVVQDLDGDGNEQTGWVIVYLHIETRDRIPAGTILQRGDRIGHPSCEGGVSTGTHLHITRKYNGEWISADGEVPFNLGGWVAAGSGTQYNGSLTLGDTTLLACACRAAYNQISW
jgi:LasA protease